MENKKKISKSLLTILIVFVLIFMEVFLINYIQLFFPNANVVMQCSTERQLEKVWICEKDAVQEIPFVNGTDNIWEVFVSNNYFDLEDHFIIDLNNEYAISVENSYPIRLINEERIHNRYPGIIVMVVYNNIVIQSIAFVICNIILGLFVFLIKRYRINFADIFENLIYDTSIIGLVGKKTIIFTIIISIFSIIFKPGFDCNVISSILAINLTGVDIYQLQNILEIYVNDIVFVSWPYNPWMLVFYSLVENFAVGFLSFCTRTTFLILSAILIKITNMILMNAIVLAVLSFLLDHGLIQPPNIRKVYLWSIFNPLVFYVAILFVQLDIFPIYCVCTGMLLFVKKNFKIYSGIMAAVLIAVGVSCKMQNILMMPTIILFWFMIALRNRKKIAYVFLSFMLVSINFLNIYVTNSVIGSFISANKQGERIWYTTFAYAPEAYIYVTFFAIVMFFLSNVFLYSDRIEAKFLLCNSLFMIGGIALIFSGTIISTPSTLIITFPAFILCMAVEDNWVKRMLISICSFLCVTDVMFCSTGDITGFLSYFGQEGIFTEIERMLTGTPEGIKWFSTLFTIARAALASYAMLFYKYGGKMLSKSKE